MEDLIKQYGYLMLFLGTFAEGETVLVLAGFLSHRGYLEMPLVILTAFLGTLAGDQFFYYLGYLKGIPLLKRIPRWQAKYERVQALFKRYQTSIILGFRFLYGLRSVTPFVIGLSRVSPLRFFFLNAAGALIWASAVGLLGYTLGEVLETYIHRFEKYEAIIVVIIAVIGLIIWLLGKRRTAGRP